MSKIKFTTTCAVLFIFRDRTVGPRLPAHDGLVNQALHLLLGSDALLVRLQDHAGHGRQFLPSAGQLDARRVLLKLRRVVLQQVEDVLHGQQERQRVAARAKPVPRHLGFGVQGRQLLALLLQIVLVRGLHAEAKQRRDAGAQIISMIVTCCSKRRAGA